MHIKSGNVIVIANPLGSNLYSSRSDNLITRQNEQLDNLENKSKKPEKILMFNLI